MDDWWGLALGVLVLVGFVVGFVLARRAAESDNSGLSAKQEIEIRKLLASPYREDGAMMSVAELSDRICQILDIDLVIPPVAVHGDQAPD